jgi:hypothetical protein
MFEEDELEESIRKEFNKMRGRILGFFEAIGLPEKQEEGVKATFKSLSYESENRIVELVLGPEQ